LTHQARQQIDGARIIVLRERDASLAQQARAGNLATCGLLITAGANPALRNKAGESAHDVASARGFAGIVAELGSGG